IGHEHAAGLVGRRSDVARRRFVDVQRQLDPARRLHRRADVGKPVPHGNVDPHGRVRQRLGVQCDRPWLVPPRERFRPGPRWERDEFLDATAVSAGDGERDGRRVCRVSRLRSRGAEGGPHRPVEERAWTARGWFNVSYSATVQTTYQPALDIWAFPIEENETWNVSSN